MYHKVTSTWYTLSSLLLSYWSSTWFFTMVLHIHLLISIISVSPQDYPDFQDQDVSQRLDQMTLNSAPHDRTPSLDPRMGAPPLCELYFFNRKPNPCRLTSFLYLEKLPLFNFLDVNFSSYYIWADKLPHFQRHYTFFLLPPSFDPQWNISKLR